MGKLFKSKKDREKEERREKRRAFRQAENAVDDVKDRIKKMEKESKTLWNQALEATKGGQKASSQRHLTSYRANQVLMTKLEQKRWVFEQYLTKMELAQSDNEFASALGAINNVIKIDPEQVVDVFEASKELLDEQLETDRFWGRLYDKEIDGAEGALDDHIPSMDDLVSELNDEAAVEIGGTASDRVNTELDERVKSGQERINKLLDNK